MSSSTYRYLGLCLTASLGLGACMEGSSGTTSREGTRSTASIERDVEDPEIFSKRENALWDGRPSFGGVWVAHPDARTPERVIIRNTENGQEAVGSLFTRERVNPGPAFQVSGEAATAIGMLAGAPTMLEVVALRVEEPAPEPEMAPEEPAEAVDVAATGQEPERPEPEAVAEAPDDIAQTQIATPTAEAEPRRQGLLGRIFGRRDQQAAPDDSIETMPIDPTSPVDQTAMTEAPAAPPPSPVPAAATAPASGLERPYIQLGIFSVEDNARNAKRMAQGADLSARVVTGSAQGNSFWRVVVGPASDAAAQRQMLARVKSLGFNDAYTVRR
ncbi:MAG: SPOR domain-containing protein [Rhodobacteraceae bacterium]|nr:MAG: SPOR domain-containing protein [Paracoccaceae bacterium]